MAYSFTKSVAVFAVLLFCLNLSCLEAIKIKVSDHVDTVKVEDDPHTILQELADRILTVGGVNADVLSDDYTLWNDFLTGVNTNSSDYEWKQNLGINYTFPLDGITFQIITASGEYELVVKATASIWGHPNTPIQLTFFFANSSLNFCFQFGIDAFLELPEKLMPNNTATNPNVTSWYSGLNWVGPNYAAFASTSFTDLDGTVYNRGITISATVETTDEFPLRNQLMKLTNSNDVKGTIVAYFPLYGGEALADFSLTFDEDIDFFSKGVVAKNLELQLIVDWQPNVELTTTAYVYLTNQTLVFDCTADVSYEGGFVFQGVLGNGQVWKNAFGLSWLTFENFKLNIHVSPTGLLGELTMTGDAELSYSTQPTVATTFNLILNEEGVDAILNLQTSILGVVDMFDDILGKTPPDADQIKVTGQVQLTIATSQGGPARQGLTIQGNAVVGGSGNLTSTVNALTAYSKTMLNFDFMLYVPVFSTAPEDIDFTLAETDPFPFTDNSVINHINFEFSVQPNAQAMLALQLAITFDHEPQPRVFDMQSTVSADILSFNGEMEGVWNHPFGLTWLQISDITIDMVYSIQQQKLTTFNINADYNATIVIGTDPKVIISFQGDFHHFTFTLTVLISDAQQFFNGVLNNNNAPTLTEEISMTVTLTISNAAGANTVDGITVQGQALIMPFGKLATAIRSLDPNAQLSFGVDFGIPIWGSGPLLIEFDFSQQGTDHLANNVVLNGFTLHVEISPNPTVDIQSSGVITLAHNDGSLTFDLSADLSAAAFSMSGTLQGEWTHPLQLSWLQLSNVTVDMGFDNFQLTSITFSGIASVQFSVNHQNLNVTINTDSTFQYLMLEIQDVGVINLAQVVQDIFGSVPPQISSLTSVDNQVTLVISTFATNGFQAGITVIDKMSVTGTLLKQLKVFNPTNAPQMYFDGMLVIPVFSAVPDLVISLSTNVPIPISPRATFEQISFSIATAPFSISVGGQFSVTFNKNPTLVFTVSGSLSATGSISFSGFVNGQWTNIFGISGFDASNVGIALGLNPSMCGVDLCISELGLGFNISFGSTEVAFYGYSEIPAIETIFIESTVRGANGLALSFQDVAYGYNDIAGHLLPHLNPADFPANWGLKDLQFYLAPESGSFDNINYQSGFYFDGGFIMLGVDCDVEVNITQGDFYFHVNYSLATFNQMVANEIGKALLDNPNAFPNWPVEAKTAALNGEVVVQLTGVDLHHVSCNNLASKSFPKFDMDYILFNGNHHASFDVDVMALYSDFSYFFKTYLQNLFS